MGAVLGSVGASGGVLVWVGSVGAVSVWVDPSVWAASKPRVAASKGFVGEYRSETCSA